MDNLVPILTDGLIEVCKTTPEDPVDYLVSIFYSFIFFSRLNTYLRDRLMFLTQIQQHFDTFYYKLFHNLRKVKK